MIIICENSYYLCKEYLHFYTKQNKNNMKTPQKRIFLLACLGLTVATITFAGKIDVPSPPGRPSACDINVNWCKLRFLKPMNDGGSRIQFYRIEFIKKESARWILQGNAENQFSYDDIIQAHVDNRVGAVPVAFRVFANNEIGRGEPSKPSNLITFEDPF